MKKVATVAEFINEIQGNLSDEAYTSFKKALAQYKEVHYRSIVHNSVMNN